MESALEGPRCPNLLIQKGAKYYLYNTKLEEVPGVNPIVFDTLNDYTQFLDWQHHVGIRCPVLYLQHTETPQGEPVYRVRPSVTDPQPGIPSVPAPKPRVPPPPLVGLNQGELASPSSLPPAALPDPVFEKILPPEIQVHQLSEYPNHATGVASINGISPNPMDPNWGGDDFAQALVDAGYYEGDQVQIAIPP